MKEQFLAQVLPKLEELENHSLYQKIDNLEKLKYFMERHVYAVFDFMSLIKTLQHELAPSTTLWTPPKHRDLARFVNEIVLCEESDETPNGQSLSHMELYLEGMNEVKANSDLPMHFMRTIEASGLDQALLIEEIPSASIEFMKETFALINSGDIAGIAASFCFGREKVIPLMFQSLLDKINISNDEAPMFHYYLKRHIEVDGDEHGPMAIKMLEILCDDNEEKWKSATKCALNALDARIKLWNEIEKDL